MTKQQYQFTWRSDGKFALLIDGEQIFSAMLKAIQSAQSHVLLEIYLVESGVVIDQFIDALCKAASRIPVYVLFDDFGARKLKSQDRDRLRDSGVKLLFFNPVRYGRWLKNLRRDHRKLLSIDDQLAFVGGMGLSDIFDPETSGSKSWHEAAVEIRGGCVADWRRLFAKNWQRASGSPLSIPKSDSIAAGEQAGRVTVGYGAFRSEVQRSLVAHIHGADRRVWLATAYFIPSWKVRRALRHATRRGIDVRLLLPGPDCDHPAVRQAGRRFYFRLLRSGVRIFEYQIRFSHQKLFLCDDWVSIGSCNIDRWNLRWSLEANQEVKDLAFSDSVRSALENDFSLSREYLFEQWTQRPWYRRLREWFWGRVDIWLERRALR
ncbi:MAG: phosphatidylserine/phosphatidylglycerophosphate/cardiolipin synthase family protein [Candidatus Thiodiazotropha sp. (ex Monitilora ramsayi)]|nr:phosphatidylserine/phosphatidylglycerophosphate/cardiolipin synthase family protein [Candidatus Thiodiazotropha sp. (ex Monitilora ramsayi)]